MGATVVAETKLDKWTWWRAALAGNIGPMQEQRPESGFYRYRQTKGGSPLPVAFWVDGTGDRRCLCDGVAITEPNHQVRIWMSCTKMPVSKALYDERRATGRWPDEAENKPLSNLPDDPLANVQARIEGALERAREFLRNISGKGPADKTTADAARNLQVDVQRLAGEAETMRVAAKEPHLRAGREVDEQFRKFSEPLGKASKSLEDIWKSFARAEQVRRDAEAAAKYEADRKVAEAERARIAAEREKLHRDDPIAALTSPEPEMPADPPPPELQKVQVGGLTGPKASLRTTRVMVITDWAKALAHYGPHTEVRAVIEKLARADQKDGVVHDFVRVEKVMA